MGSLWLPVVVVVGSVEGVGGVVIIEEWLY